MTASNSEQDDFMIYGKNPVSEAVKADEAIKEVYVIGPPDSRIKTILSLCEKKSIPYSFKKNWSDKKKDHQGIIALLKKTHHTFSSLEHFFEKQTGTESHFFLILDSITDPRNFGAILRSCDHFGVTAVITTKDRSAPITPVVYKTSSGAINYVAHIQVKNLVRSINWLKKQNFWIYGMDASGDRPISACDFKENIAVVIGSEGSGMRRLVKESCDFLVRIENLGHVDSLNVSVASGILMYEVIRQRQNV